MVKTFPSSLCFLFLFLFLCPFSVFSSSTEECVKIGIEVHHEFLEEREKPVALKEFYSYVFKVCQETLRRTKEKKLLCPIETMSLCPLSTTTKTKTKTKTKTSSTSSPLSPQTKKVEESISLPYTVKANATKIEGYYDYPETMYGLSHPNSGWGMAMSGGGNRALVSSLGQFRAFSALGLMHQFETISSVSGGTWATAIYEYYQEGAQNDTDLLGNLTSSLSVLTLSFLDLPPPPLGLTATTDFLVDGLVLLLEGKTTLRNLWINSVSHTYLEPFGLGEHNSFYTWDHFFEDKIKSFNPSLQNVTFYLPRNDRPFWVANSILIGPIWSTSSPSLTNFQYSPLYVGGPYTPEQKKQPYPVRGDNTSTLPLYAGGGFVDNFAFGGDSPNTLKEQKAESGFTVNIPRPFAIQRAVGLSSDSGVWSDNNDTYLVEFIGTEDYWPILPAEANIPQHSEPWVIGDGGCMENIGLLPLIQRGFSKVAAFINTDDPLPSRAEFDACVETNPPTQEQYFSEELPPLFGVTVVEIGDGYFQHNQVFETSELLTVMCGLQKAIESGGPPVFKSEHVTVENDWWGIPAGHQISIVWYYLQLVDDFVEGLPQETQDEIAKGTDGLFPYFPEYKTVNENSPSFIRYSNQQVNLLAAFTEWCVTQTASLFQ